MTSRTLGFVCCWLAGVPALSADEKAARWDAPVIDGYGYINPLPGAALQPDPAQHYKVVFDVAKGAESPHAVNRGLWHVARTVNLFGRDNKPAPNLDIVVVIHGDATRSVLNDDAYKARFSAENPDADLLRKLEAAGVKVYVCGQAIVDSGYYYQNVRDDVEVVLAAVAAEIELATQGYVLISL
ncbi:MAG: DsrE family protein [Thiohalocapsa sp.]|uniref:DsrE family protein n=1 Tax=Thiohalocapsa sp. TaxID=2497641 RepID=UPI0025EF42B4|nr:DsrE family protein [Thiohalocapsa sp.]MCG6942336.1 DsrE family protein [Thiohalocapsa sp.]